MGIGGQEQPIQLRFPKLSQYFTPGVIAALCLMIIGLALISYAPDWTRKWLMLDPPDILRGHLWKLVTYSLVNGGCGIVLNALGVLLCGSAIEHEWSAKSFLVLWLVVAAICGTIWTVVGLVSALMGWQVFTGVGSGACVFGIFGVFGVLFRKQKVLSFFFIMEAQQIVLLLIGIGVVLSIPRPITLVWVAGAGVGYLYVKLLFRFRYGATGKSGPKVGRFEGID